MKNFLLLLLFPVMVRAQIPYVEILPATDTETLTPKFRAYVSTNTNYGIAFFQMGTDSMNLQDCALALILTNPDTVLLTRQVPIDCDSFYFYQAFVLNNFHSSASNILSFSAPACTGIEEATSSGLTIAIIPNPVTLISEIQAPPNTRIEIYDLLGRRKNVVTTNHVTYLHRKDFVSGLYILRASHDVEISTRKLSIE